MKRCCKNHRRIYPRDLLNQPIRHKEGRLYGSIATIALPRGRAYPYSSARQNKRNWMNAVYRSNRELFR